jgi:hypothetical protein
MLVCEKVLRERDDVTSAIRIVDVFYVPDIPADAPTDATYLVTQAIALLSIRSSKRELAKNIHVQLMKPDGAISSLYGPTPMEWSNRATPIAPPGCTYGIELQIVSRIIGTYWIWATLDGDEVARTVFTLRPIAERGKLAI